MAEALIQCSTFLFSKKKPIINNLPTLHASDPKTKMEDNFSQPEILKFSETYLNEWNGGFCRRLFFK